MRETYTSDPTPGNTASHPFRAMRGITYITECQGQEFWSGWKGQCVNGSWTEEWSPEEMPRKGTRPKKAEGSFLLNVFFFSLKTAISSPLPPNCPSYQSQAKQIENRLLPHGRTLAFLRKGLEGKYPGVGLPLGGWICSVAEWSGRLQSIWVKLQGRGDDV